MRSPSGSSRLDMFVNDVLRPPGRQQRRRNKGGSGPSSDGAGGGIQKLGISTVDMTPKGARAQVSQGVGRDGGAIARTPNTKGLAVCTSPAAFPPWNGPASEHPSLLGMNMMASPCSRLVMDKFGPQAGITSREMGVV
jgi:hypothetical protein